jgi:hypothetical protein
VASLAEITPFGDYFSEYWLPGVLAWILIYISDYVCTIVSARLYQAYARAHIVIEGSFELNPVFQADVNKLRWISPRFLILLVVSSLLIAGNWLSSQWVPGFEPAYPTVLGAFLLMECAIHMRHIRNLVQFCGIRRGGMSGQVVQQRGFILRNSAAEFLSFAVLFSLVALFQSSWFFLGGTLSCLGVAAKHWVLARRWEKRRVTQ